MSDQYMELYTKLSRLQWLLQRHHMQTHAVHGPTADPTKGQGRVLAILKLQPELSTKDLTYLLGIRQQSLNELLGKLEKSGHVVREPSPSDRRVMLVKLTEKGKSEPQPKQLDFSDIFSCLSDTEQDTFAEYLDRVIAALEAQLTDDERGQIDEWMRAARTRLGNDFFERFLSSRGGRHAHHGGGRERPVDPRFFHDGADFHGYGPGGDGREFDREHFRPHCDGRMPGGCGYSPADDGQDPPPPPPPPHGPHDPDDE